MADSVSLTVPSTVTFAQATDNFASALDSMQNAMNDQINSLASAIDTLASNSASSAADVAGSSSTVTALPSGITDGAVVRMQYNLNETEKTEEAVTTSWKAAANISKQEFRTLCGG